MSNVDSRETQPSGGKNACKSLVTGISDRQTALLAIKEVAKFFETTEPHSPLPYMLHRVVRWGNLPLPDLLKELINDEKTRFNVFDMTGIELKSTN